MRLLDAHSISEDRLPVFHELLENGTGSPLRYAILSHTWGKRQDSIDIIFDDVPSSETFAKFFDEATQLKQWQTAIATKKIGFSKVLNACRVARESGIDYVWIDSCCIDKSKSAELNESINSMYRWYQKSKLCIVYLEDLEPGGELNQCRWFKRGWTLQELVAPSKASFYAGNWDLLGERSNKGLCKSLASITGIDMEYLQGGVDLSALSIAHRMSWAKGRETTVPEDRAYSLMGIFDVKMPLIYGEGSLKAFQRLQEEIVKSSSDLSIFAWDPSSPAHTALSVFASTPNAFTEYKDIVPSYQSQHFTRTNKGIKMKTILWRILCADGKERLMLPIGKQMNSKYDVGLILRKVGHNMYLRIGNMTPFSGEQITSSTSTSTFYLVFPHISTGYDHLLSTSRERAIVVPPEGLGDFHIESLAPEYAWDGEDGLFFNNHHWGGSDWRALELLKTGSASSRRLRLIALLVIGDPTPRCYLLRWSKKSALLFDRRHQTKTTRLDEFRYMVVGATNEIRTQSSGTRWSLTLIPKTTGPFGRHFRLDLQELPLSDPAIPSSVDPTASDTSLLAYPAQSEVEWEDALEETARKESNAPAGHRNATTGNHDVLFDGVPELANQSGRSVFSQFQITEETLPGSSSRVGYAALSEISRKKQNAVFAKPRGYRRPKPKGLYSLLSNWIAAMVK